MAAYSLEGNLTKRILVSIPALALLVSVIYVHGLYAKILVSIVALLCIFEMMRVSRLGGERPIRPIGYMFGALLFPAYQFVDGFVGVVLLLTLAIMSTFIVLVLVDRDAKDGLITVLPLVYPGLFLAFLCAIVCIPQKSVSQFLLIIAFVGAAITDSFAYFCGRLVGKHKLIPRISPKKTVEGAVGGTVFGTCAVFLTGHLAQEAFDVYIDSFWYIALGLVLSVLTQFGDLSASIIKRKLGAKDYGKIMAEHGGAMDRLDSVLFISPVVYAFYLIAL